MRIAAMIAVSSALLAASGSARAQQSGGRSPRDLAALLPADTLAVVDLSDGARTVERALALVEAAQLPWRFRLLLQAASAVGWASTGLWPAGLGAALAPHQALLAAIVVDGRPEPLVLARVGEPSPALERLLARFGDRAAADVVDGVLAIARDPRTLARYRRAVAEPGPRLADRDGFFAARPSLEPGAGLRVFVDLDGLRLVGNGEPLWNGLDPGARFLVGPIASLVDRSSRFDGVLSIRDDGLVLDGRFDGTPLADRAARLLFAAGAARYDLPPAPEGTVARLTLDRSLLGLWSHLDELLSEDQVVQASSFLSIADQLLGASFVDDLLPALGEPMTVFAVASSPDDDPERGAPLVDLPSLVLVAPLRDPRVCERLLGRMYRTLVQVVYFQRRQRGDVAFQLRRRRDEAVDAVLWVAEPDDWRGPGHPPAAMDYSPTLTFVEGHAVLASTRRGAVRAARALLDGRSDSARGDELFVDPRAIADYLARNRALLELDAVLDKGVTVDRARQDLDAIIDLLALFARAELELEPAPSGTVVTGSLEIER